MVRKQFFGFIIVGGVAAAINVGSRIVLNRWMPYSAAIVVAYIVGMSTAFILNRLFVFRVTVNPIHRQAFWFTVVNLAAVAQTLVVSLFFAKWLFPEIGFHWHTETVAHACGVIVPVVTSFIGHKHLSFKNI
jgi:putative flippase GtrA